MDKRWMAVLLLVVLAAVALGGVALYYGLTRTTLGLVMVGESAPAGTLVGNLSSGDRDVVMSSLGILQRRGDAAGQVKARELLTNSDDYLWFNAALYLGAIGDTQAVPYLIKGLKHPAWRAYPEVVRELETLTGEKFGMDQEKWIAWWRRGNPGSAFSFSYASLEKQSAEIQTGSNVLINGVSDPVTVSYLGSPIAVIGVRVKPGASAADAQRVLETAVMGQMVEIERDGVRADGRVPALMWWEPDPINKPDMADVLRRGLPPVPFAVKTSVQKYLLESGLYEVDLGTVEDAKLRGEVEGFAAATRPAGGK